MPISKTPVIHKFGIISLSQAEQLIRHQRLKDHIKQQTRNSINKSTSCPVITIDFITKYNSCPETEREPLNGIIKRVLEHAKYKACSSKPPSTTPPYHYGEIDVSEGWLELTMLCQCCGPLQEEALLTLAISLSSSPISTSHIPALFYMAGLCYHWLKSETISTTVLRSGELLLLQVLYEVSMRLYYHYLAGILQDLCSKSEVRQLKFDLEGFECREKTYQNFPEALLQWRVAMEVGHTICEQYNNQSHQLTPIPAEAEEMTPTLTTPTAYSNMKSSGSVTGSHGGRGLSPILWHSLDVWQCAQQGYQSLDEAIQDLVSCSIDFNTEQWLQGLLAMNILCNTAQININVLQLVQSLAAGNYEDILPVISDINEKDTSLTSQSMHSTEKKTNQQEDTKVSELMYSSRSRGVTTLNVLGMQPAFREPFSPSVTCTTEEEEYEEGNGEEDDTVTPETAAFSPLSVGTQALLDTESIPDTLAYTYSTIEPSSPHLSALGTSDSLELSTIKISSTAEALSKPELPSDSSTTEGLSKPELLLSDTSQMINDSITNLCDTTSQIRVDFAVDKKKKVTLGVAVSVLSTQDEEESVFDNEVASSVGSSIDRIGLLDDRFEFIRDNKKPSIKSVTLTLPPPRDTDSRCTHYTHSTAPFSCGAGVLGSQVPPSTIYQQSVLSLPQTIDTSLSVSSTHNFTTWSNEIQFVYTLNMADIVILSRNSSIKQMALQGASDHFSYSLTQLADFGDKNFSSNTNDTWQVRHCAVLGLSRVVHSCREVPVEDGFSSVAWAVLQTRQSYERDTKVLEAYKIHQACSSSNKHPMSQNSKTMMTQPILCGSTPTSSTLIGTMAQQLVLLFLPNLSVVIPSRIKKRYTKQQSQPVADKSTLPPLNSKTISAKVDTGRGTTQNQRVKPETYSSRLTNALNVIAKRHWEVQMEKEKEEDEKDEKEREKQKEMEYEEKMKRRAEKLAKNRPKKLNSI